MKRPLASSHPMLAGCLLLVATSWMGAPAMAYSGGHGGGGHGGGGAHMGGGGHFAAGAMGRGFAGRDGGRYWGGGYRGGGWGGWGDRGGWGRPWYGGGWGWNDWGWGLGLGLGLGYGAWALSEPYVYNPYPWGVGYGVPVATYPNTVVVSAPSPPVSPQGTTYLGSTQSAPAPVQNWFYCESAKGYYPYVPQCPEPWRAVPAVPPGQIRE